LREPNLGKTNPRVSLVYSLAICFAPSLADSILFLTLTRLVVVFIFVNFSFALFTPPLGDYQPAPGDWAHATPSLFFSLFFSVLFYLLFPNSKLQTKFKLCGTFVYRLIINFGHTKCG
jgi:hypothetical protein